MNLEVCGGAVEGDGICSIGLHFDRISTTRLCHVNDTVSVIDVAVVVGGHFSDDVWRMVNADWAIVNAEILLHILSHRHPVLFIYTPLRPTPKIKNLAILIQTLSHHTLFYPHQNAVLTHLFR